MPTTRPALCSSHRLPSVTTCAGCGLFLCPTCGGDAGAGAARCARCRGAGHPVAWEDPTLSAPVAFGRTLRALTSPDAFYAALPWTGGLRAPLTFATTAATLGAGVAALFAVVAGAAMGGAIGGMKSLLLQLAPTPEVRDLYRAIFDAFQAYAANAPRLAIGGALLTPLLAPLQLLVLAAITHALARTLGGQGTFEATVRAQGYAMGGQVLRAVPGPGPALAVVIELLLTGTGLRRAHGVSTGRAIVLTLWPFPVAAVFLCLFLALFLRALLG